MLFSLSGKTAVITGGGSGIGYAIMQRFAKAGANCVIGDLPDAPAQTLPENVKYLKADVTNEGNVKSLLEFAYSEFGQLDILINNAGVFSGYHEIEETTEADFDFCYRVNTLGPAFGVKHAPKLMPDGGAIVTIASLAGLRGSETIAPYVASKHAVVGLTKTAALELAARNIRVNCICPSTVMTAMAFDKEGAAFLESEISKIPMGRAAEAEEIAALAHFLSTDDCSFLTGQAINVSGGMVT